MFRLPSERIAFRRVPFAWPRANIPTLPLAMCSDLPTFRAAFHRHRVRCLSSGFPVAKIMSSYVR